MHTILIPLPIPPPPKDVQSAEIRAKDIDRILAAVQTLLHQRMGETNLRPSDVRWTVKSFDEPAPGLRIEIYPLFQFKEEFTYQLKKDLRTLVDGHIIQWQTVPNPPSTAWERLLGDDLV